MKNSTVIAIGLIGLGLGACEFVPFTPASRIEEAKARIAILSSDPTSVQWSEVQEYQGNVCGIFNFKERVGYGQPEWTGAKYFVTQKGEPNVVDNYSPCETLLKDYAACSTQGDAAKITEMVSACKTTQAEMEARHSEDVADRMREAGLVATGEPNQDQKAWDAMYNATRYTQMGGFGDPKDRIRWAAGERFTAVYNAEMRKLPEGATQAQKLAASPAAIAEGTRQAEAVLKAGGVV